MKTPEEMAVEHANNSGELEDTYVWRADRDGFLAGYKAAKDEEATKDQKIAALWAESIEKMLPNVHKVVLFPSNSTEASEANKARDAEIIAKMDAPVKKAKVEDK